MHSVTRQLVFVAATLLLCIAAKGKAAVPLGIAISYQGQLKQDGIPVSGSMMMEFKLFDALVSPPGLQVGTTIVQSVDVVNGLFTVELNGNGEFGVTAFNGEERFLEVTVGGTTLLPRQPMTGGPYAHTAINALNVPGIDGHSLDAPDGSPVDAVFVDDFANFALATGTNLNKLDSGGVSRALMLYDGTDNLQILAPPDKTMSFRTGTGGFTSVRATITAAGRLGINTAAPDALVHIQNGDVGATALLTTTNLMLERTTDNLIAFMSPSNRMSGLALGRPGNTAAELLHGAVLYNEPALPDAMQFRTGGNVTRLTIDSVGGVGIGTTMPAVDLHILGGPGSGAAFQTADVVAVEGGNMPAVAIGMPAAGSGLFRFSKPSRSDAAKIQYNAATGQLFVLADGAVFLGTDSGSGFTSRMTVANDGNVGIGTNAPSGRLHVVASPSGNGSVVLPSSSISAAEIFDEPGCSGTVHSTPDVPFPAAFPNPPASILSHTINAPTAGHLLAFATVGTRAVSTGAATCQLGLTTSVATIPADALHIVEFQPASTPGLWSTPVTLHRLFPVSAGTTTVHVVARATFGSWEMERAQLSLLFIPTAYGTTAPTDSAVLTPTFSDDAVFTSESTSTSVQTEVIEARSVLEELRNERAALRAEMQAFRELKDEFAVLQAELQAGR